MKTDTNPKKIKDLLSRGIDEVIDFNHLKKGLISGKKLRIKLGIDPTSPNLHLGQSVPLLKLKDFQELGHQIVLIIGDFTGLVGDTSDKHAERPALTDKQIRRNLKTYIKQVGKILHADKTEIRYNSEWLAKLDYREISEQADIFSLAEFIARKNIRRRLERKNRISLRELLYPLMQGYDSVAIKADVEIGGTDQRFNLLAGRRIQEYFSQEPQDIITLNLMDGLDGRKMSSSWGNTINLLDSPKEMFGKVMSMIDSMIITYFENCTRVPMEIVKKFEKQLSDKNINPRDIKMELAYEITKIYWGERGAEKGKNHFVSVIQKKNIPDDMPEIKITSANIIDVLVKGNLVKSKSDARRLIEHKGIKVNGEIIKTFDEIINKGDIIQKGKRHFVRAV
ncbi:MAG: tyrosine--tRNA ligase [Candidatus Portnoybacteria bacterium]|nr:tyrosine--tRNA ligase [Candidatus Portnoybacteria bacterium]